MKRYCLALDLKDDPALIREYIEHHQKVWPGVLQSIRDAGIQNMQIYHRDDRLFMIIQVDGSFSFERKARMDAVNATVQAWEKLMSEFQQVLPSAQTGEKWMRMDCIFDLNKTVATARLETR